MLLKATQDVSVLSVNKNESISQLLLFAYRYSSNTIQLSTL